MQPRPAKARRRREHGSTALGRSRFPIGFGFGGVYRPRAGFYPAPRARALARLRRGAERLVEGRGRVARAVDAARDDALIERDERERALAQLDAAAAAQAPRRGISASHKARDAAMQAAHSSPRPLCSTTALSRMNALGPPGARQLLRARATSSPFIRGASKRGALDLAVECAAVAARWF